MAVVVSYICDICGKTLDASNSIAGYRVHWTSDTVFTLVGLENTACESGHKVVCDNCLTQLHIECDRVNE